MTRVHCVVFDVNGTLADTRQVLVSTRLALLKKVCELLERSTDDVVKHFREFLWNNSYHPDIIRHILGVQFDSPERDRIEKWFRELIVKSTEPCPGVMETLRDLKRRGVRTLAWSGGRRPFVLDTLRLLDADGLINTVYCRPRRADRPSSLDELGLEYTNIVELDDGFRKPCPKTLLSCIKYEGVDPANTILVSNSVYGDGESTISIPVRFVHVMWGQCPDSLRDRLAYLTDPSYPQCTRCEHESPPVDFQPDMRLNSSMLELLSLV
jgi:phosphoglycolate phosphatase-like HAD superfamily hydrolase